MFSLFRHTMILKFPHRDALRTVLANKVSDAFRDAPAHAGSEPDGTLYVEPSATVPRAALAELKRLGIQSVRTSPVALERAVANWLQLVPLDAQKDGLAVPAQAVVLFDLHNGQLLGQISIEILRLGNDRQGLRWLGETPDTAAGTRALLRVVGPPYYTLLRALSPPDRAAAPRAYLERAARVWVELGYDHPLAAKIKPPANQILLLSAPDQWELLPDAPFRDVYDVLEFNLPAGRVGWQDRELTDRLRVSLKLIRGGAHDAAELWVLRDNPVEQLNAFVQSAEDQLLNRLAFAVGEKDGQKTIVLRVRPSKLPPPVVVLPAESFAPYRKMPNLYLPCGWRLHPPLRRDVVRKKLADDPATLTWLFPGESGAFVPESLPDLAFRPLSDWVDYVIDHEQRALQVWIQAAQFEFEAFTCEDDAGKPRKPPADRDRAKQQRPARGGPRDEAGEVFQFKAAEIAAAPGDDLGEFVRFTRQEPSKLQLQLAELEGRFVALEGNLDVPERQQLWPDLARVNAALHHTEDAGLCYANAVWQSGEGERRLAREWFTVEAQAVAARPERTRTHQQHLWTTAALGDGSGQVSGDDLDLLLGQKDPSLADVRALGAYLVWAAALPAVPEALAARLNAVQRFLETHERLLPVRSSWLAWSSLTQMAHNDVLALARARDRLLERLFQHGLRPEHDLPGFLRFAGQPTSQRFRGLRTWMEALCFKAHHWIKEIAPKPPAGQTTAAATGILSRDAPGTRATHAYADLLFAFGLARLGESDASRALAAKAEGELTALNDEVHTILLTAFQYRLAQIQANTPPRGPLPAALVERIERIDNKFLRYKVDRLRERSRIVEPEVKLNAYTPWIARASELDKKLADVTKLQDRKALAEGLIALLAEVSKGRNPPEARARVLRTALDYAPLVNEEFALDMLGRLAAVYDALPATNDPAVLTEKAELLEKALFTAGHFDRREIVEGLIGRFSQLLQGDEVAKSLQELDKLASQSFRGLRKLGMREEIDLLLRQLAEVILEGKEFAEFDVTTPNGPTALRALLHVAAAWFFHGRDQQAEPILNAARSVMYKGGLLPAQHTQQTRIACAYATTVGNAPIEVAQKGLEELLERLTNVWDSFTTISHYSLSQLEVIEAIITAIVNEDHTMGADARRWLDEDEFLVRRRIHRDLRDQIAHSQS